MNIILYANGTSENHGCEAIADATVKLLDEFADKFYCTTTNKRYERESPSVYADNPKCEIVEYYYYRKKTLLNLICSKLERSLFHTNRFYTSKAWFTEMNRAFEKCEIALSVGGDNYCNPDPEWLYQAHEEAIKRGLKTILWGCSVEEDCLADENMRRDLKKFDVIYARESLSYRTLKKIHGNVYLYPDTAFLLGTEYLPLPEGFAEGRTVGLNVSPTVEGLEREKGMVRENYEYLIQAVIERTNYQIALIPHVVFDQVHCDYEIQHALFTKFKNTGRVIQIGDHSCRELKGYIARCKLFITARTHASIAAYSSLVPTVVVGYSVKAIGIAADLFGTDENYVVPVQGLSAKTDLYRSFQWLDENQEKIRKHLETFMPAYIQRVYEAKQLIEELK